MEHLAALTNLECLDLFAARITDAGCSHIRWAGSRALGGVGKGCEKVRNGRASAPALRHPHNLLGKAMPSFRRVVMMSRGGACSARQLPGAFADSSSKAPL